VGLDRVSYAKSEDTRSKISRVVRQADTAVQQTGGVRDQSGLYAERMKKQFKHFQYREIIPQLQEIVLSALPGAKTNPADRELYEAFDRGDVARVMQVKRPERKQLFVSTLAIYYSDDLDKAQFEQTATMRKDAMMRDGEMMDEGYDDEMMAQFEQIYGKDYVAQMMGTAAGAGVEKVPGFVVMIEGYSPYRDVGALLDPPNVRDDPSRWGLVTRLDNLKQFLNLDVNAPFELFTRSADHFKIETGPVDLDLDTLPMGVGTAKFIPSAAALAAARENPYGGMGMGTMDGTLILVDPVTQETISAEPVLDQYGKPRMDPLGRPVKQVRDNWFKLQFKLEWKEAPETPAGVGGGTGRGRR
jgi:hypothetical protein